MTGSTHYRSRPLRVLLGVTGGIAAYKALELVRLFRKEGWEVTVAMTRAGRRFVGVESFRALSGNPVAIELFPTSRARRASAVKSRKPGMAGPVEHVDLAASADLVVVAPATANIIGKLASGIADDLLSTLLLAVPPVTLNAGRVMLAPSMNTNMWQHNSVQDNVRRLREQGYIIVAPASGELACGTHGPGRMAEPAAILEACRAAVRNEPAAALNGISVIVTAGRTEEPLDPVRVVTNRSSGRLGVEICRALAAAGADVTLIAGPMSVPPPSEVRVRHVTTTGEMLDEVLRLLPVARVLVMCAAVADYRPVRPSRTKQHTASLTLRLERTPDILRAVTNTGHRAILVGFSLDDSLARARAKLRDKHLDLIVANPPVTAGADTIQATLVFRNSRIRRLPLMSKSVFARRLVSMIPGLLQQHAKPGRHSSASIHQQASSARRQT
ncbi:MAG: bifunctional phosphopantothenoylcysteine decarboxylase/phosphopantothenate--cysteine ligase CoaBC [candidate division WOR-3 bacterium]